MGVRLLMVKADFFHLEDLKDGNIQMLAVIY